MHPRLWQETFGFRGWTSGREKAGVTKFILTCPGSGIGSHYSVGPSRGAEPQPVLSAGVEMLEGVAGEAPPG